MKDLQMLVVEDNHDHYQMIDHSLRGVGIDSITHFSTGEDFIRYLERCSQDERFIDYSFSIILDLRLPGMTGEDVLNTLKSHSDWSRIPVVVLTVSDDPELIIRCHKLGCSYFIIKPVEAQEFKNAVSQLGSFISLVELPSPFRKV